MKCNAILLHPIGDMNHPFVHSIQSLYATHPISHLVTFWLLDHLMQ